MVDARYILWLGARIAYLLLSIAFALFWWSLACCLFVPYPLRLFAIIPICFQVWTSWELCLLESIVFMVFNFVLAGVVLVSFYFALLDLQGRLNRSEPLKPARSYSEFESERNSDLPTYSWSRPVRATVVFAD